MPRKLLFKPSFIYPIRFPTFTLSWNNSLICYAGGGGSAKTGVSNKIIIIKNYDEVEIDTGESICAAVTLSSKDEILAAGVDKSLKLYETKNANLIFEKDCTKSCISAIAFSCSEKLICIGCDDGTVDFWNVSSKTRIFSVDKAHNDKAVCAISFSVDDAMVVTSGKDGTARVWDMSSGTCLHVLKCRIGETPAEEQKFRNKPILVRGCRFLPDYSIITIASSKRGKAFLTVWKDGKEMKRCCVSQVPISAMDITKDFKLITLGGVDGTITLLNINTLRVIKKFEEMHDLPVTCIAARPFLTAEDHEDITVISASADNKMAFLSLVVYRTKSSYFMEIWILLFAIFTAFIFKHCYQECTQQVKSWDLVQSKDCFRNALIAEDELIHPWISVPPH